MTDSHQQKARSVRFWFRLLLITVLFFVIIPAVLLQLLLNNLVFYPDSKLIITPDRVGLSYQDVRFKTADGLELHGWYVEPYPPGEPLAYVLFFHGNAGNISHFLDKIEGLSRHGLAVLAIDYRGFGLSQGRPSEKGAYLDAEAAYKHLLARPGVSPDDVVIYGYSLGGAVGTELAMHSPARALVLESTFTSIRDMSSEKMPFIPRFLVRPIFETQKKIGQLKIPALFVHGLQDDVVPASMGRRLHEAHPGPKDIMLIPGAGHHDVDLIGGEAFYSKLLDFIRQSSTQ